MVSEIAVQRRRLLGLLLPSLVVGACVGTVVGGIVETVDFPVVGTFFGAVEGGVSGAAAGLIIGLLLIGIGEVLPASWQPPRAMPFTVRFATRTGQLSAAVVIGRAVAIGAIGGGGLGALAGLIIGLVTHPPTAPFAVVEGGVLCAVSGVVVSLPIAAAVLATRLRVRR
jgi:hypothetical protein